MNRQMTLAPCASLLRGSVESQRQTGVHPRSGSQYISHVLHRVTVCLPRMRAALQQVGHAIVGRHFAQALSAAALVQSCLPEDYQINAQAELPSTAMSQTDGWEHLEHVG